MLPSLTVAVGRLVVPSFSTIVPLLSASAVMVTVNSTPVEAGVPSAISTEHVPENVAVPLPAEPLLTSFGDAAHITGVKITPGTANGATVPYTVRATVSYGGKSKPLTYKSELTVVRGKTTGHPYGLGLGLYIASEIVRAHHGKLTVTSTAEGTTTFRAALPCTPLH